MKQTLIITGASKGIGLATATLFASRGYKVVNLSRSACPLDAATNIKIDLAKDYDEAQLGAELRALIEPQNQITLVHNAAAMTQDTVADLAAASLRSTLELNVVAASVLNRLLLPQMAAGSSIIYISSTLGTKAVANRHAYVVSKHAVIGQMRATCQDLVGKGVHTAAICPGFTETEMLAEHLGANPGVREQIAGQVVMGRLVEPSEIADSVWFAAQHAVINGAVLHANLGQVER